MENAFLSVIPRLADDVSLDEFQEQRYLYNRATSAYALLDNAVAREVARLVDGHRRIEDICKRVEEAFLGATPERTTADVIEMLTVLERESFIAFAESG